MYEIDIQGAGFYIYPPGSSYGPYVTKVNELVWIAAGNASLETGGRTHQLPPHTVVASPAGSVNEYRWDPGRPTRHGIVGFTLDGDRPEWPLLRQLEAGNVVIALLEHVRWLDLERPAAWEEMGREALACALRSYLSGAISTADRGEGQLPLPIERSLAAARDRWLPDQPWSALTLTELAAAAAVSPEHLCRVYASEFGCGPVAVIRLLRLRRAADLLTRSNLPLAEIAGEVGFQNQFHFSRSFKQAFGVPPTAMRSEPVPELAFPDWTRRLLVYF